MEGRESLAVDIETEAGGTAMGLGQGITDMVDAVRDRVEVSWHHETWHVTAGSFESALAYVDERFDDPVVLSRHDHGRRWTRVTLDVDRGSGSPLRGATAGRAGGATDAPGFVSRHRRPRRIRTSPRSPWESDMPADLEAIFASQDARAR